MSCPLEKFWIAVELWKVDKGLEICAAQPKKQSSTIVILIQESPSDRSV